jgi:hypothetical protein
MNTDTTCTKTHLTLFFHKYNIIHEVQKFETKSPERQGQSSLLKSIIYFFLILSLL